MCCSVILGLSLPRTTVTYITTLACWLVIDSAVALAVLSDHWQLISKRNWMCHRDTKVLTSEFAIVDKVNQGQSSLDER